MDARSSCLEGPIIQGQAGWPWAINCQEFIWEMMKWEKGYIIKKIIGDILKIKIHRYKEAYPDSDVSDETMKKNLMEMADEKNVHQIYNNHIQNPTSFRLNKNVNNNPSNNSNWCWNYFYSIKFMVLLTRIFDIYFFGIKKKILKLIYWKRRIFFSFSRWLFHR